MNYLIQRGKVREQAISVPEGLPELLSDITREVLRCQPTKECLCQFIIDYLHSVIVTREKSMVAKGILDRALRQVDSIISDLCICDLSKEKTELMAGVMEDCFRNFLEKRRCDMRRGKEAISFDNIDIFEELLSKCNFSNEEMVMSRPAIESAYKRFVDAYMAAGRGSNGTDVLYQYFRDRELKRIEEMMRNQAALRIQASWRGYYARSRIAKHICTCTCMEEDEVDMESLVQDKAARVIQRFFRSLTCSEIRPHTADPCGEAGDTTKSDYTSSSPLDKETIKASETTAPTPTSRPVSKAVSPKFSGATLVKETSDVFMPSGSPVAEASVVPEAAITAEPAVQAEPVQETVAEAPAEVEPHPAPEEVAPAEAAPVEEASAEPVEEPSVAPAEEPPEAPPTDNEPAPEVEAQETSPPPADQDVPPEEPVPTGD